MFKLPPLPYSYDALEPYIDALTMEIHYTKHHKGYVDKLNEAIEKHPELFKQPVRELLSHLEAVPEDIRTAVRNQGGGDFNHTFFWPLMCSPSSSSYKDRPQGTIAREIDRVFGSFEQFKARFSQAAKERFGSGWAWLCQDRTGGLIITSTANQDSPVSEHRKPILGLDVWEHAYYLKYHNKRVDYIEAWWHVVNWDQVERNYLAT
jgi:superoxide dismutase, Fe-Mn family